MNQRIENLIKEAQDYAEYESFRLGENAPGNERYIFNKMFAELIVKECADVCYDADYVGHAIAESILKHFGVE